MSEPDWKSRCAELERQLALQDDINQTLIKRAEHLLGKVSDSPSLLEAAAFLESEVEDRTERLDQAMTELQQTNQALMKAKAEAEAASTAKSQFLANMSHEIRTPLTSIIGFSETLYDDELSAEERNSSIESILRAGRHLLRVINDILDLSKIEADKLDIEHVSVDFLKLLKEVETLADMQAKAKSLTLQIDVAYPMPERIESDPLRLKQILFNLIGNAIKFTEQGGVRIEVSYLAKQRQIKIDVVDTGIGLSDEQQANLFQAFTQADVTTTRKYGGTGLGLYLSKNLAAKLGGDIALQSKQGAGSTFSVTVATGDITDVPLLTEPPKASEAIVTKPNTEMKATLCSGHVLLVDDNRDNQSLISMYLRRLGATVTIAENGLQAIEQASSKSFDLILMDVQMPVMSGLEATKILRERACEFTIVALTANSQSSDVEQCLAAGCDGFLSKPIDRNKFDELVRRYLPEAAKTDALITPVVSLLLEENDPELNELLGGFIGRLPDYFQKISAAHNARNWPDLKSSLHTLKGVCGNYGYPELGMLAAQAERCVINGNYQDIDQHIENLHTYRQRILAGYQNESSSLKNAS